MGFLRPDHPFVRLIGIRHELLPLSSPACRLSAASEPVNGPGLTEASPRPARRPMRLSGAADDREEHALRRLLAYGVAAGDQQLEVGLGLHRGHALAEQVELVVRL